MGPIIDLTMLFPYRIILHLAEGFAAFNICHSLLKDKYNSAITFMAVLTARIIVAQLMFNTFAYFTSYLVLVIVLLLIFKVFTKGEISKIVISVVFIIISKLSTAVIMAMLASVVYQGKDYEEVFGTENLNLEYLYMFLCHCILAIAVSYLFAGVLKFFYRKKAASGKNNRLLLLFSFFPASHIMIMIFSLSAVPTDYDDIPGFGFTANFVISVFLIFIMLFDCLFPFAMDHFEAIEERNILNERALTKSKMEYQQVLMRKEDQQEFRKIRHDYANLITAARGFIEMGKPEKALEILQRTNDDMTGLSKYTLCSNETVNTIIYMKKQEAEKAGVTLKAEIEEHHAFCVVDYDLCRVLGNLIDNAVNALKETEGEKTFTLTIEADEDFVRIKGENPYNAEKEKRKGRLKNRGNGKVILKEITAKYGGSYAESRKNGIWYTDTVFKNIKIK